MQVRITALLLSLMLPGTLAAQEIRWRFFGTLLSARAFPVTVHIGHGKVLVIGGIGPSRDRNCEIIDVNTGHVELAKPMLRNRHTHTALFDKDSNIIVIGGYDNGASVDEVERYDRTTGTWSVIGSLLVGRAQHAAYWLDDDRILVVGGRDESIVPMALAEIFTVSTGKSVRIRSHPFPMSTPVTVRGRTGQWAVVGGRGGQKNSYRERYGYSYVDSAWTRTMALNDSVCYPATTQLWDGRALICGGAYQEEPFVTSDRAYVFDGTQVHEIGRMTDGRQWAGVAQISPSRAVVAGGNATNVVVLSSSDWIDLDAGSIRPGPSMKGPRVFHGTVSVPTAYGLDGVPTNAVALVIGGRDERDSLLSTIEILARTCSDSIDAIRDDAVRMAGSTKTMDDDGVLLTDAIPFSAGAIWRTTKVSTGLGFTVSFRFRMMEGHDGDLPDGSLPGADGIVFVVQNDGPAQVGKVGEGIGYDGTPKALAVEFDTYLNPAYSDPDGNHIAVQTGGLGPCRAEHVAPYNLGITTKVVAIVPDGRIYHGRIDYHGRTLKIYLDTTGRFDWPALVVNDVDLAPLLGLDPSTTAWIGFTSATGKSVERHELLSWTLDGCSGLATSVADGVVSPVPKELTGSTVIVPMPSQNRGRLYTEVVFGDNTVIVLEDAAGRALGTVHVRGGELRQGFELPFHPAAGSYLVRITDGMHSASVPWIVLK
ncbi:MAG: hypothetical protein J0I17_01610 ['Candidatus Kapabacteria' thiocyanatum]|nr:hypothetical protein ['Candidatus Kapabacteria' thiocyanatum]